MVWSFGNFQIETPRLLRPRFDAVELSIVLNIVALKRVANGSKSVSSSVSSLQIFGICPSVTGVSNITSCEHVWIEERNFSFHESI